MPLHGYKWKYQWWRVDKSVDWEPIATRINNDGEEIVQFLGVQLWNFKSIVGGEFGPEIKENPND